ncbi:alpha/beta hydrolase [Aspergillus homomorphus CBS 101889]|uniref:AB hydrolase-1 domain-containing protein n=1 Tax=Aspergillus homomorphus (strain CBS 101889) TaxID=1450537 RepID=A0A395HMH0_ASPHC|nr:hypothetical protein BO97DRAFT_408604 [Aspergillus homomorphus CBS 101889]RAL08058.1 hypothetical protein BO97DRAFT_408604 [Aspergillus homomorphus CBS 101889]
MATNKLTYIQQISVFIPGFGCPATDYIPLITYLNGHGHTLNQGHVYLAIDLPGHGQSPTSVISAPETGGINELLIRLHEEVLSDLLSSPPASLKSIPTVLYGHSMGTLAVLDLLAHTLSISSSSLNPTSTILFDSPFDGTARPTPLDIETLPAQADQYRPTMPARISRCFGPRTTPDFATSTLENFSRLDLEYAMRVGHYYQHVDARFAQILQALNDHNAQLVAAGNPPVRLLDIQGQEGGFGTKRKSLRKGDVTAHMRFARGNWMQGG